MEGNQRRPQPPWLAFGYWQRHCQALGNIWEICLRLPLAGAPWAQAGCGHRQALSSTSGSSPAMSLRKMFVFSVQEIRQNHCQHHVSVESVFFLPGALPAHDSHLYSSVGRKILLASQTFTHVEMPQFSQTFQRKPRPSETFLLLLQLSWNNLFD